MARAVIALQDTPEARLAAAEELFKHRVLTRKQALAACMTPVAPARQNGT